MEHITYPTLKPRLVAYPTLKPRLVEHTHGRIFLGDVSIRNSLRSNNGTLYAPRYEEAFWPIGKKRHRSLRSLGLASLLVERYMRQGCLVLAVGRVRSKQSKTKKTNEIPPDTKKTHHEIYPQQPGDRDHLETAYSETRPTR